MKVVFITIFILLVQAICPILANINTDRMKDKNGIITIKSRFDTKLTEIQFVHYYSLGGKITIILTDIYVLFVYLVLICQNINVNDIICKFTILISILPISFIVICGIICFVNIKRSGDNYLIKIKNNKCNIIYGYIIKVVYYPIITKLEYADNPNSKSIDIKCSIWNDYFISVLLVIEIMIVSFVLIC